MSAASPTRLEALVDEAQRVLAICNACRYCEGYCAVFPALQRRLAFDAGDVQYLANLCHNCGACLDACQYAPPHEFDLNFPRLLARIRPRTWERFAWPAVAGRAYARNGTLVAWVTALALAAFLGGLAAYASPQRFFAAWGDAQGSFYAVMPHGVMAGVFGATFGFALVAMAVGVARFWSACGERPGDLVAPGPLARALHDAATLRYLDGGGEGCVPAGGPRSDGRRHSHHALAWGFVLCFASTATATVYHYGLGWKAPYPLLSIPVVLGTVGGLLMVAGCVGLGISRERRDPERRDPAQDGMDRGLTTLLMLVASTGLVLLALRETAAMGVALAVHLGSVMALFLLMPYGKFMHAPYRFAALVRFHLERRRPPPAVAAD